MRAKNHRPPKGAHWQHHLWASVTSCHICGFVPVGPGQLHLDHIVPKWRGGKHVKENAQIICANCHGLKTARESLDRAVLQRAGYN